jgi:hypothetical protein
MELISLFFTSIIKPRIFIGCKKENIDIPIDTLYEYFKNLNENDDEADTFLDIICDDQMTIF